LSGNSFEKERKNDGVQHHMNAGRSSGSNHNSNSDDTPIPPAAVAAALPSALAATAAGPVGGTAQVSRLEKATGNSLRWVGEYS
jgi:hypothetical protein